MKDAFAKITEFHRRTDDDIDEVGQRVGDGNEIASRNSIDVFQAFLLDQPVLKLLVAHGLTRFDEIFAEVHRSNMSKLGADGKPIIRSDGKILKGPNYTPPDLGPLLS